MKRKSFTKQKIAVIGIVLALFLTTLPQHTLGSEPPEKFSKTQWAFSGEVPLKLLKKDKVKMSRVGVEFNYLPVRDFRLIGRFGSGLLNYKPTENSGQYSPVSYGVVLGLGYDFLRVSSSKLGVEAIAGYNLAKEGKQPLDFSEYAIALQFSQKRTFVNVGYRSMRFIDLKTNNSSVFVSLGLRF